MDVDLIQVPYDSGRVEARMGRGPGALLDAGAAERVRAAAGGRVAAVRLDSDDPFPTEATAAFELAGKLAERVAAAHAGGRLALLLAGNCMSSVGTLAGLTRGAARIGVVWLDAHGDLNTPETSPGGFLDGMALAVVTGRAWQGPAARVPGHRPVPDDRVLHLGARALDPDEAGLFERGTIANLNGDRLRRDGPEVLDPLLADLAARVDAVYLHLDLDVHDADALRVNPYAEPGGPSPAQVRACVERICARLPVAAAALTAYAPEVDPDGRVPPVALELLETIARTRASAD